MKAQTCPAAKLTTFLRNLRAAVKTESINEGKALTALLANLLRSPAKALSLPLNHSATLLVFFLARLDTIVEITKPKAESTAVIVKPCSLNKILIFSFSVTSLSRIFPTVCFILSN